MLRWLAYATVALAAVLVTALVMAPAQWLAGGVQRACGGHVELAEAQGSLWQGEATVVLSPGGESSAARVSLPQRLSWQLSPWRLLTGQIVLAVAHPSALAQPLAVYADLSGRVDLGPTVVRLPAAVLTGLGAPFNTIKPGGIVTVAWQRLRVEQGRMQGDLTGEWQFASSALTRVAPFGHYRLLASGGYPDTQLALLTLSGPLELSGDGTIGAGGRLRFSGRASAAASAAAPIKAQLAGLLLLLGRMDGESAILSLGN